MRRAFLCVSLLAALAAAQAGSAALVPVERSFGELTVPRVGEPPALLPQGGGPIVRVLLRLRSAPLAEWNAARTERAARLDARTPAALRYSASLAREQAAAERALRLAVPRARVERRHGLLLNALAVALPPGELRKLVRLPGVTAVYPSLRYTLALDRSPGVVGADALADVSGASGEGVRIAVVDDGIDPANPFFEPRGLSYPGGFPRGDERFTSAKVIVARAFPAFGAPPRARLPFDEGVSYHGTHVAGIAAGVGGATAPAGADHPETAGLSGVAPRAFLGNYRVFSIPTPLGVSANTPEIVAAFEQAVLDGMDVINFSGGGPEVEPANDALVETIANVVAAGVVPVVAAGNDGDDFGPGSVGTPGTVSEAITVAAVSNARVFAPALTLAGDGGPGAGEAFPYVAAFGAQVPAAWRGGVTLVDVSSLAARGGGRVEAHLCSPGANPVGPGTELPPSSLEGAVAVALRGRCPLLEKTERAAAAGAVGLVLVDNRPGEASTLAIEAPIPTLSVADLDGVRLRTFLAASGGRGQATIGREPVALETGRSGVVTAFSSLGPTAFRHGLKPDLAAPGGYVLSSTDAAISGVPFAVFDGTSMATPHVAGGAALLLELHPDWEPWQVRSALVSTAGPAFADTARTREAGVTQAGGGLLALDRAAKPLVFTRPAALSLGDLAVGRGPARAAAVLTISDADGGAGRWSVALEERPAAPGASLSAPAAVTVPAGGSVDVVLTVEAAAGAEPGEGSGFLVLGRDGVERRVPYLFYVSRPALAGAPLRELPLLGTGSTARGRSLVDEYHFPAGPFGPFSDPDDRALEDGAEQVYSFQLGRPVVNVGVAAEPLAAGVRADPFLLGSLDEGDLQGYAAAPVNVNPFTPTYLLPTGAAGATFPTAGRYTVAVDSGREPFTGRSLAGPYLLHAWVDDLAPPFVGLETRRLGRRDGLLALRALDDAAGVDPLSLAILYDGVAVGAALYDPLTGLALFPLPPGFPLDTGRNRLLLLASDYQEAKNVLALGTDPLPNTGFREVVVTVDPERPAVSFLEPDAVPCTRARAELLVTADGPRRIRSVRFYDGERLLATDRTAVAGSLFAASVRLRGAGSRHRLRAVAVDAAGALAVARRTVSVCS